MSHPVKLSWKSEAPALIVLLAGFLLGFYFWRNFPAQVPTHWDISGQVNGYSSAAFAAFFLPCLNLGLYLLFLVLPYLDPKKGRYADFVGPYHGFKDLLSAFLLVVFALIGANGLGYQVPVHFWLPLLLGLFFIVLGNIMSKVKMNWFFGIRTPWTLSSETVWDKTHRLSAPVFSIAGLLIAATILAPWVGQIILFSLAIIIIAIGLPLYSYILYWQEERAKS